MRRRKITIIFAVGFFVWNVVAFIILSSRQGIKQTPSSSDEADVNEHELEKRLHKLENEVEDQVETQKKVANSLLDLMKQVQKEHVEPTGLVTNEKKIKSTKGAQDKIAHVDTGRKVSLPVVKDVILPILVIACNRVTITRNLDQLLKYRPSKKQFPIIVSQDCGHRQTTEAVLKYTGQVQLIQHPDLSDIDLPKKEKKWQGYYKISRHYKWALTQIFQVYNYSAVIIVEDDLDIAPDFYEYFLATYPLLLADPTLWCISAWNDNGKTEQIMQSSDLLYRTDFFPGLGWMLTKSLWFELAPVWPPSFWDDWIRQPQQRKDRACIRPEVSRTSTFGKNGVSKGQFFDKYLKFIQLNSQFVPFTKMNLTYLLQDNYDAQFVQMVYNAPLLSVSQVRTNDRQELPVVRVQYKNAAEFKRMAKELGIMDDLKSGVPRTAYRGIVPVTHSGRRVYLAPPANWTGYNPDVS